MNKDFSSRVSDKMGKKFNLNAYLIICTGNILTASASRIIKLLLNPKRIIILIKEKKYRSNIFREYVFKMQSVFVFRLVNYIYIFNMLNSCIFWIAISLFYLFLTIIQRRQRRA